MPASEKPLYVRLEPEARAEFDEAVRALGSKPTHVARDLISHFLATSRPIPRRQIKNDSWTYELQILMGEDGPEALFSVYVEIRRTKRPEAHAIIRLALHPDLVAALRFEGLLPPYPQILPVLEAYVRHIELHLQDLLQQSRDPDAPHYHGLVFDLQDFENFSALLDPGRAS